MGQDNGYQDPCLAAEDAERDRRGAELPAQRARCAFCCCLVFGKPDVFYACPECRAAPWIPPTA